MTHRRPHASLCVYGGLGHLRARMHTAQMKNNPYTSQWHALTTISAQEGIKGFYRGWLANTLKVVPQNSIR